MASPKVNVRDIGDKPRLKVRFYALGTDAPADPTAAYIIVRHPVTKVETPHVATKEETGLYYHEQSLTVAGDWHYRGFGIGAVEAAAEHYLTVRESKFDDPLATP